MLQLDLDVGRLVFGADYSQSEGDPVTLSTGMALRVHAECEGCGLRLLLEFLPRRLYDGGKALAHLGYPLWVFEIDRTHPGSVVQYDGEGEVCL